jgi:hypothetical protein
VVEICQAIKRVAENDCDLWTRPVSSGITTRAQTCFSVSVCSQMPITSQTEPPPQYSIAIYQPSPARQRANT